MQAEHENFINGAVEQGLHRRGRRSRSSTSSSPSPATPSTRRTPTPTARIAYQTAWLKANYPHEYLTAVLMQADSHPPAPWSASPRPTTSACASASPCCRPTSTTAASTSSSRTRTTAASPSASASATIKNVGDGAAEVASSRRARRRRRLHLDRRLLPRAQQHATSTSARWRAWSRPARSTASPARPDARGSLLRQPRPHPRHRPERAEAARDRPGDDVRPVRRRSRDAAGRHRPRERAGAAARRCWPGRRSCSASGSRSNPLTQAAPDLAPTRHRPVQRDHAGELADAAAAGPRLRHRRHRQYACGASRRATAAASSPPRSRPLGHARGHGLARRLRAHARAVDARHHPADAGPRARARRPPHVGVQDGVPYSEEASCLPHWAVENRQTGERANERHSSGIRNGGYQNNSTEVVSAATGVRSALGRWARRHRLERRQPARPPTASGPTGDYLGGRSRCR